MRYPEFLQDGGTIGFVAPSFGCATEPYRSAFMNAQKKLKKKGHNIQLGPNCYEAKGIGISNTPDQCAAELMQMYASDQNDILISCGGGELMCEILNEMDFDRLSKEKPKWFLGYSDNTNFTFLLTTLCDTASIYGPCAAAFGMEPWHSAIQDTYDILRGKKLESNGYDLWEKESLKSEENPLAPYHVTEARKLICYNAQGNRTEQKIQISGRLLGGCMDCLVNLLGTSYDRVEQFADTYAEDGIIWFLESCDLNVMTIRRAVWQMKNAGWFKHVKGFMIGRPAVHGQELMGLDQYEAVMGILRGMGVPVIMDADFGHIPPAMPLITGAMADLCVENQLLKLQMKCR